MPWNATVKRVMIDRLSRKAIIGVSTGSTIALLVISIIIGYLILRWRKKCAEEAGNDATQSEASNAKRPPSFISIQEIGHRSIQEVHAISHLVELLDGQARSGSKVAMSELQGLGDRESSTSRFTRISDTLNLSLKPDPLQSTLTATNKWGSQDTAGRIPQNPFHTRSKSEVNKALPLVPGMDNKRGSNPHHSVPVPAGFQAAQNLPVFHQVGRKFRIPNNNLMTSAPGTADDETYATIFDIEEYQGKGKAKARKAHSRGA